MKNFGASLFFATVIVCLLFGVCQAANPFSFDSNDGQFHANWKISANNATIFFNISAKTNGWLSLGLCDSTAMAPADMFTGWVDSTNTAVILDTWSPNYNKPLLDSASGGTNDIQNPQGTQSNGWTTLSFTRNLNTGDTQYDMRVQDKMIYLLWASYPQDGTAPNTYQEHDKYGSSAKVNLFQGFNSGNSGGTAGIPSPGGADPTGKTSWASSGNDFAVEWDVDRNAGTILIKMTGKTTGWISFGISMDGSGKMGNADCYTGWVYDNSGLVVLIDTFSPNYNQPLLDTDSGGTEDATLVNGAQNDTHTTITFSRKLKTGDTANDADIVDGNMKIMWGIAPNDGTGNNYPIHTKYDVGGVNFFTGSAFAIGGGLGPGAVLAIVVLVLTITYLIFRFSYVLLKQHRKYQRKQMKKLQQTLAIEVNYQVPKEHNRGYNRSYYRGSTKFASSPVGENQPNIEEEITLEKEEKGTGSAAGNKVWGVLNKRLPRTSISFLSILVAFFYLLLNLGCLYSYSSTPDYKSIGSLLAGNALLVALPATRNSFLVLLFHIPFDKTIQYHRWLGMFVVILTTVHSIMCLVYWSQNQIDMKSEFSDPLADPAQMAHSNLYGLIGWIVAVLIFASSIEPIRRRKFEAFYYTHFLFLAFYVFGSLHNSKFIPYMAVAATCYILDRILRMLWGLVPQKTTYLRIKDAQDPRDKVLQMRFPKNKFAMMFHMYKVGQYVFINFPQVDLLEWHPFSVSAGPDETSIEVHIKGLGDHTSKLVAMAAQKEYLWVRVDGPYGHLKLNYRRFPVLVLVAGGIGMTPVMGILRDMFRIGDVDPRAKQHRHCVEAVYVIWTVQNEDQYCWFVDELNECWEGSQKPGMPKFVPSIFVTRIDEKAAIDPNYIRSRPDFDGFFDNVVTSHPKRATTVFACGPSELIKTCWDCVNVRNRDGNRLIYHHETFDF